MCVVLISLAVFGCDDGGNAEEEGGEVGTEAGEEIGDEIAVVPATFTEVQALMANSCNFESCHGNTPKNTNGNLSLLEEGAYEALVGVIPDNAQAAADGMLLVDPGNPENSFLMFKLEMSWDEGGEDPDYGFPMPQAFDATLSDEKLEAFRSWILDGAPNN